MEQQQDTTGMTNTDAIAITTGTGTRTRTGTGSETIGVGESTTTTTTLNVVMPDDIGATTNTVATAIPTNTSATTTENDIANNDSSVATIKTTNVGENHVENVDGGQGGAVIIDVRKGNSNSSCSSSSKSEWLEYIMGQMKNVLIRPFIQGLAQGLLQTGIPLYRKSKVEAKARRTACVSSY